MTNQYNFNVFLNLKEAKDYGISELDYHKTSCHLILTR